MVDSTLPMNRRKRVHIDTFSFYSDAATARDKLRRFHDDELQIKKKWNRDKLQWEFRLYQRVAVQGGSTTPTQFTRGASRTA